MTELLNMFPKYSKDMSKQGQKSLFAPGIAFRPFVIHLKSQKKIRFFFFLNFENVYVRYIN